MENSKVPANAWAPGSAVGRYQLLAPIAEGGMAEIWLARQPGVRQFDKVVVIKRMMASLEADGDHVEMFLSEARLAAQLNHPNVVQIFELGEHEGSYFIAMEYLDGENLSTVRTMANRKGTPIPFAIGARLTAMAAEGLHYAHTRTGFDGKAQGIVHRDVSPQNLIVTYEGGLKLVDFGIAKIASEKTTSGKLKGKLRYMSPEQGRTEPATERSDIFALGMVLFEMATNTRMFPKLDDLELLRQVTSDEPLPRARKRRPEVPVMLDEVIATAIARKPEDRFASAREMQNALESYLRSTNTNTGSAEVSEFMKSVFQERITERRKLIESAMAGELNPSLVPDTFKAPSVTQSRRGTGKSRRGLVVAVAAAVLLAGLIAGAALELRGPTEQPVPVVPVVPVAPVSAVLEIDTEPPGATVVVDSVDRGKAPLAAKGLASGEHLVTANLEGYQPTTRTVPVGAGERLHVVLTMAPVLKPTPVTPVQTTPVTSAPRKKGKLNLNTVPWTNVYSGSTLLGETPLQEIVLPAGKVLLRLTNPEKQINTTVEVEIRPGETTSKTLHL